MTRLVLLLAMAACANKVPETRYYQLAMPSGRAAPGAAVLSIEPLETASSYDDDRIVYRTNPYRFDYYEYHRWSATPGVLVGNYLEQAFERSGRFGAIVHERDAAAVSLRGRVIAIEEVDRSKTLWVGHLVLQLELVDTQSGEVVWTQQFEETEPMPMQRPEGLARALSVAMARIAKRATPVIAQIAEQRTAMHAAKKPATSAHR